MVNGPLGGNMGTPPVAPQPPQVSFTTTAESRGGFNNFLKSIPQTTAMTPIPPLGSAPTAPMSNPMGNIDIFNQPPSTGMGMMGMNQPQMNPMMQPPMMGGLMGKPVQNFYDGGFADSDFGGFSDYGSVDSGSNNNDDNNDFSFSDDTVGDTSAGDFTVGDTEDRSQSDNFQSALDNITLGSDNNMFSNDPASATPMGLSYPSGQNFGNRPTINANDLNLLKSEINNRNEISLTEEDKFFNRDGSMKPSGIDELNKRNATDLQLVQAGNIPISNYISSGSVLDNLDLSKDLALDKSPAVIEAEARGSRLGKALASDTINASRMPGTAVAEPFDKQPTEIDPFDIQPTFQNTGLSGANLPNVDSPRSTVVQDQIKALANLVGDRDQTIGEKLQQNILEERGRALGPTTFRDDAADVTFENMRGQTPTTDTVFDIDTTDTRNFVGDDFAPALDIFDARQEARQNALAEKDANVRDMDDIDRASAGRASDFPTLSTSTVPEDFEENVGRPFDAKRMEDIERLYGVNTGQAGYGTGPIPNFRDTSKFQEGQDPTFLEGLGVPTPVTIFGDAIERKTRENMANEIALGRPMGLGETFFGFNAPNIGMGKTKATDQETIQQYNERTGRSIPDNQIIRNDSGRVIGIRDASGRLVSGMDPNAPIDRGDDNDNNPFIRRLPLVKTVADVEEDKTPNVFGGSGSIAPITPKSVVVDSPFTTNVGDYSPTGFDGGDLNDLIARLLKTSNPKSMNQGGVAEYAGGGRVMQALDNLLATG